MGYTPNTIGNRRFYGFGFQCETTLDYSCRRNSFGGCFLAPKGKHPFPFLHLIKKSL
jgi:hypothetical protein